RGDNVQTVTRPKEDAMRKPRRFLVLFIALLIATGGWFGTLGTMAQDQAPEVAQPGGDLPGEPSLELVKVADGLIDPINVQSAHDGSGRLFILERTGTIRILDDG